MARNDVACLEDFEETEGQSATESGHEKEEQEGLEMFVQLVIKRAIGSESCS